MDTMDLSLRQPGIICSGVAGTTILLKPLVISSTSRHKKFWQYATTLIPNNGLRASISH